MCIRDSRKAWLNLEGKRYYVGEDGSMEKNGWFAITGVNSTGQEYSNWYFAAGDGDIIRDEMCIRDRICSE